ncbi:hypothetical protein M3Y99_00459600 [Aphelenchoides fujianensis]|nr:hypothetical protein M3Y99_00459600 [Aphelenchoides fujianensis]
MGGYSEHCCCGIHVHKGCLIIAILGIIGNIPLTVNVYGAGSYAWYFGLSGASAIISFICYVCLLIGNIKKIPVLYLPLLILNTIILILTFFLIIWIFIGAGLFFAHKIDFGQHGTAGADAAAGTFSIIVGICFLLAVLIQVYFTHVVWRGYKYLKEDCLPHHHGHGHPHVHVAHVA